MKLRMCALLALVICGSAWAEQKFKFGEYEVHYVVLPTTFLNNEIADRYDLVRSKDRSLINISVLDGAAQPIPATISGSARNLLEQSQQLEFDEVREGDAIYYLALLRHGDEEFHRVAIDVTLPDGSSGEIRFQQQMFFEE